MLRTRTRWRYRDGGGADEVADAWTAPSEVDADIRAEAQRAADQARAALHRADGALVSRWLVALGSLCAGQMAPEDARGKLGAYVALLDYPGACYTQDTLREAGRRFRWLPSYAELTAYLDEIAAPMRRDAERLAAIAAARPALPQPRTVQRTYSDQERAGIDARNAALVADLERRNREIVGGLGARTVKPSYLRHGPFDYLPSGTTCADLWPSERDEAEIEAQEMARDAPDPAA